MREQYFICSDIFPFPGLEIACCAGSGKSLDGFLMGLPLVCLVAIFEDCSKLVCWKLESNEEIPVVVSAFLFTPLAALDPLDLDAKF